VKINKQAFKSGEGQVLPGGFEGFTQQQVARGVIGDGQRIAVFLITQQELALVVGAP